jgi:protein phosphatase
MTPRQFPLVSEDMSEIHLATPHDHSDECGPFDIIGDVHGCFDELVALLLDLGYEVDSNEAMPRASHPAGRRLLFLGDLVDRGPKCPAVLRLAMDMVRRGEALCIMGNHDNKLLRKLSGRQVQIAWGLAETLEQLESESDEFKLEVKDFISGLATHYVLDNGALVIAHAGLRQELQGRTSKEAWAFCLFGEVTGEKDDFGYPVRKDWAREYAGPALVAYGHTPVEDLCWVNNTINLDTGCVYGGRLSALRYPERELVQVEARSTYCDRIGEREAAARMRSD